MLMLMLLVSIRRLVAARLSFKDNLTAKSLIVCLIQATKFKIDVAKLQTVRASQFRWNYLDLKAQDVSLKFEGMFKVLRPIYLATEI